MRQRRGLIERLRHPQTTVRWRLTILYGGLFLICGAALLAVTYALANQATVVDGQTAFTRVPANAGLQIKGAYQTFGRPSQRNLVPARPGNVRAPSGNVPALSGNVQAPSGNVPAPSANARAREETGKVSPRVLEILRSSAGPAVVRFVGAKQRISDLHQLEIESGIALAIMAIISGLLGWVIAGRVLRPLRTITETTQQLSEANLHERLALAGPRDELRTLSDTIDGLLARLERAFDAQRRFVANASHELRTPLAASRALLEMATSDPRATVESLRAACNEALEESEQQEQLIDALLALAQGERGLDAPEAVDLAGITQEVQRSSELEAVAAAIELNVEVETAAVLGDRRLLARLVSNLVQNAIRHNLARGDVTVRVENRATGAALTVTNTGPMVPPSEIPRLLQPFQRIAAERVGHREGFGLGLSIVAAVAAAHEAALEVRPRVEGGLEVEVRFPPAPALDRFPAEGDATGSGRPDDAQDDRAIGAAGRLEDEPQVFVN